MNKNKKQLMNIESIIKNCKELNWDGQGAIPISDKTINSAIKMINEIIPSPLVYPTNRGSIQLEYENEFGYLEFEIFEETIKVFCTDKNGNKIVSPD